MDTGYLTSQVATIIGQLHGLFDEIGVPNTERESRESELFAALSETLHNQVKIVSQEKNDIAEECRRIITTIKQMAASMDDVKNHHQYEAEDEELNITYPLNRCLKKLKEKHLSISKVHKERFEQVKKLVQALESYSSHLEPSFVRVQLPPTSSNASIPPTFDLSPSYVESLDDEFTRVYEEFTRRVQVVKQTAENIIQLWAELGTPQAQTDGAIVKYYRDSPEQLGLHEDDIARLRARRDKLMKEKDNRERHLQELRELVESLWDKLGVEEPDRKRFLNANRGCGVRQINEFEDELSRLNDLKRQNLHLFVEDARFKLQEIWDALYFSEEEMLEFTPAFSDVYSDALLEAHEQEIARLEQLKEQRAPILTLIDRHRTLVKEREELASASQDASRLMMRGQKGEKRDPTRLLREEKMRKRIAKELPKLTIDLRKTLEQFEDEYGRPFMVHGENYLDELEAAEAKAAPPMRSRTPAPMAPPPKPGVPKNGTVKERGTIGRANSAVVARPPTRSGARTPANDTIKRNPSARSLQSSSSTPSRLPARAPLSNITAGGTINSPERRGTKNASPPSRAGSTIRKMGQPSMGPPPKMRDLFVPPEEPTPTNRLFRAQSLHEQYSRDSRAGSMDTSIIVRQVQPEDDYDDRSIMSRSRFERPSEQREMRQSEQRELQRPYSMHSSSSQASSMRSDERYAYAPPPVVRQTSTASTAATSVVSCSDNWETYSDVSEPEQDHSDEYLARLRAARQNQQSPDDYPRQKKASYQSNPQNGYGQYSVDANGNRIMSGNSDANWTTEDEGY